MSYGSPSGDRTITWAAAAGFAAVVAIELVVILTPSASQYEFSIYGTYPAVVWILGAGTLFLGQAIVLRAAFAGDRGPSRWWLGLLLVLVVEAVLLLMPYFRGYPVYGRGDVLTHVGFVRSIHASGMVGPQNIYPNIHLAVLALSYATGVDPMHVINTFSVVSSLFFVTAAALLVTVLYDRRRALFTLPFVTLLIVGSGHLNTSPFVQSTQLVPFVIYLFVRERETRALSVRTLLAVVLLAVTFYHPLTTLFLLFLFGTYRLVGWLVDRGRLGSTDAHRSSGTGSTAAFDLMFVLFVSWYSNFNSVLTRFRGVVTRILLPVEGESTLESYSSLIQRTTPAANDVVLLGFVKYGIEGLLMACGGLYVLGITVLGRRSEFGASVTQLSFAGVFGVFSVLWAVFFVVDLPLGPGRIQLYATLFGGLLAGSVFAGLSRPRWRPTVRAVLVAAVAVLVVLSVVGLYHSPFDSRLNPQATGAELHGSDWFLAHWEADTHLYQRGVEVDRFRDALHGTRGWDEEMLIPEQSSTAPPDHYGYRERRTFGGGFASDRYLVVSRAGREYYPHVYPDYQEDWRFTAGDTTRLEWDPTVTQVYDNGGFDAYLVRGTNATDPAESASQAGDDSDRPIP